MNALRSIRAAEFHYRIFVSLSIVWLACLLAYATPVDRRTVAMWLFGASGPASGFVLAAVICALATLLRMWAGTVLRSQRIMSFGVRPEMLAVVPPYTLVRNPIYLSDVIAAAGLSLCMPWPGLAYPVLMALHYRQLILWEESSLGAEHGDTYGAFLGSTPRLMPTPTSCRRLIRDLRRFRIDHDGARFNAVYLLFVPGLLVSAWTGHFFHAVLIGLPAVADWAYWHTRKGLRSTAFAKVTP